MAQLYTLGCVGVTKLTKKAISEAGCVGLVNTQVGILTDSSIEAPCFNISIIAQNGKKSYSATQEWPMDEEDSDLVEYIKNVLL